MPKVGPNDVLIKIKRSAICGTDLHIYNWDAWAAATIPVPMVVGHEYAGEIVEHRLGGARLRKSATASPAKATSPAAIAATAAPAGGICAATPWASASTARALSPSISACRRSTCSSCRTTSRDDLASILDPLGNAVHTALSFDLVGEDVLITGAGPIGIMAAADRAATSARAMWS